jgi:hypothetical protein
MPPGGKSRHYANAALRHQAPRGDPVAGVAWSICTIRARALTWAEPLTTLYAHALAKRKRARVRTAARASVACRGEPACVPSYPSRQLPRRSQINLLTGRSQIYSSCGEQPWRIGQDDPSLLGSNPGDLVDADQQQRPAEQACPHLEHLRLVRALTVADTHNPPDPSRWRRREEALAAAKPVPAPVA